MTRRCMFVRRVARATWSPVRRARFAQLSAALALLLVEGDEA